MVLYGQGVITPEMRCLQSLCFDVANVFDADLYLLLSLIVRCFIMSFASTELVSSFQVLLEFSVAMSSRTLFAACILVFWPVLL